MSTATPTHAATTAELARRIRDRELSAREVLDACLARIERVNPAINAVVTLDVERARERADAADRALAKGELWGPLHGVPFTLKDGHSTAGVRTTVGHPAFASYVPDTDGAVAARLKTAGAILVGKTNVPPMLMSAQTQNDIFGRTSNPWNLARTSGGSSGGAAAAVAAELVPFDVGSDMSGSIRIPSHYCGVFGLKPTANRIPLTGHIPPPPGVPRLDRHMCTVGPIARSAEDLSLVASVLVGPDGTDTEVPPLGWRDAAAHRREVASLRIAFMPSFPGVPTSRDVRATVERVARELERAGARVDERDPGFEIDALRAVWADYFRTVSAVLAEVLGTTLPVKPPEGPPPTLGDFIRVLDRRDALINAVDARLTEYDAFLSPASISTAFEHGPPRTPIAVDGEPVDSRFVDHYLYPFNMLGHPAVVVPAAIAGDGLPIGVQLVGKRWADEHLLGVAAAVAEVTGGYRAPPEQDLG